MFYLTTQEEGSSLKLNTPQKSATIVTALQHFLSDQRTKPWSWLHVHRIIPGEGLQGRCTKMILWRRKFLMWGANPRVGCMGISLEGLSRVIGSTKRRRSIRKITHQSANASHEPDQRFPIEVIVDEVSPKRSTLGLVITMWFHWPWGVVITKQSTILATRNRWSSSGLRSVSWIVCHPFRNTAPQPMVNITTTVVETIFGCDYRSLHSFYKRIFINKHQTFNPKNYIFHIYQFIDVSYWRKLYNPWIFIGREKFLTHHPFRFL